MRSIVTTLLLPVPCLQVVWVANVHDSKLKVACTALDDAGDAARKFSQPNPWT
jgi:hypothetical protein